MSEPNLFMEAGRLEGMANMIDRGVADSRRLSAELRAMAERLAPDRSQARGALEMRTALESDT